MACSTTCLSCSAETITTGMVGASLRRFIRPLRPCMPGMFRSSRIRSRSSCSWVRPRALSRSAVSITSLPGNPSAMTLWMASRNSGWSSAIRILYMACTSLLSLWAAGGGSGHAGGCECAHGSSRGRDSPAGGRSAARCRDASRTVGSRVGGEGELGTAAGPPQGSRALRGARQGGAWRLLVVSSCMRHYRAGALLWKFDVRRGEPVPK